MKINLKIQPRFRLPLITWILLGLMGIAFVIAMVRFVSGIGAISNLSNAYPWGFWVSFDLYTGIAISSGAFIITSIVYIFELEQFRPLVRPALLTGILGYIMEVIALLVDLGHPERIWHYFVYQNFSSFLLIIGLFVMAYTAIMIVEFAPTILERFKLEKQASVIRRFMKPLVIIGAVISTLHQGALGSLLLIQPTKLHPLWWTAILPILFFISAIAIGLAMIIFESTLSSRYFKRGLESHLLNKLGKSIPIVLAVYLVLKFGEIIWVGDFQYLFSSGVMSILFWVEIMISSIIPIVWFSIKRLRQNPNSLLLGAIILLVGMIFNRFNVSWFALQHADPITYIPTFMSNVKYIPSVPEVAVSIGIFAAGILAFGIAAKYLPIFEEETDQPHLPTGD
ncbi:NrfD/PsrC family molybdoenzyme membrane anchor subunit [Chloroflexota bacterium]